MFVATKLYIRECDKSKENVIAEKSLVESTV